MQVSDDLWGQLMALKASEVPLTSVSSYSRSSGFKYIEPGKYKADEYLMSANRLQLQDWKETIILNERLYLYHRIEDAALFEVLRNYWPIIFLSKSKGMNLPFILVHMAQSLDGKVCTLNGHSKWIGNGENLTHAHRLRACVDGILVGGNTLANDLPRLDVRHVVGENPTRLFLTSRFKDIEKLPIVENSTTYVLKKSSQEISPQSNVVDKVIHFDSTYGLLQKLKQHGISSILLEGGTKTVSSFWEAGHVDWVQLHIAPIVLGSGKSCVALSKINHIDDGFKIDNLFYSKMGDAMMVTGQPKFVKVERNTDIYKIQVEQV